MTTPEARPQCKWCDGHIQGTGATECDGCWEFTSRLDWFLQRSGSEGAKHVQAAVDFAKRLRASRGEKP